MAAYRTLLEPLWKQARAGTAATRCKHAPEERIRIVLEGFRREVTVRDLCLREAIKPPLHLLVDQEVHGGREGAS